MNMLIGWVQGLDLFFLRWCELLWHKCWNITIFQWLLRAWIFNINEFLLTLCFIDRCLLVISCWHTEAVSFSDSRASVLHSYLWIWSEGRTCKKSIRTMSETLTMGDPEDIWSVRVNCVIQQHQLYPKLKVWVSVFFVDFNTHSRTLFFHSQMIHIY